MLKKYVATLILIPLIFACTSKAPTTYILDEKDLVPEGIAYKVLSGVYYMYITRQI